MNLTFSQAVERTKDLAGAIKAARAHEADCAADHAAKQKIADIAGEAHEKASAHCIELEQEREELADHMAALVRKTGETQEVARSDSFVGDGVNIGPADAAAISAEASEASPCDHSRGVLAGAGEPTRCADCGVVLPDAPYHPEFNSIFSETADFQAAALANGVAKMNAAFDEATR